MKCNKHNEKEAVGACVTCGLPFCRDCIIEFEDKYYCKTHAIDAIGRSERVTTSQSRRNRRKQDRWAISLLLCIFLGATGIHRFYLGRWISGLIWLCTGGLLGIGWVVDVILIAIGELD